MKRFAAATHYPFMKPIARLLVVLLLFSVVPAHGGQGPTRLVTISYRTAARCGRIVRPDRNPLNPNGQIVLTPRNNGIFLVFVIDQIENGGPGSFTLQPDRLYVPAGNQSWNVASNLGDPPAYPPIVSVPPRGIHGYAGWVVMEYSKPGSTSAQLLQSLGGLSPIASLKYRTAAEESAVLMAAGQSAPKIRAECTTNIDLLSLPRAKRLF